MRFWIILIGFSVLAHVAVAQNITGIEYFFNTDPGVGAGTSVPVTPAPSISDLSFNVGVTSLSEGFHTLFIRTKDANNQWSATFNRPFYKLPASTFAEAPNITRIEYFFNTDPGPGAGTAVAFTSGKTVTLNDIAVSLSSVSDGFHTIFFRAQDGNGNWSDTFSRPFYKLPATTGAAAPNITKLEYFIDNDPGSGAGTNVPFTPGTSIIGLDVTVALTSVSDGFHTLTFRAQDANGRWSHNFSRPFYKLPATTGAAAPNITKLEYFVDNDPGPGAGTNVPVTPGTSIIGLDVTVALTSISDGFHTLTYRAQDANGRWSHNFSRPFYKLPASVSAAAPNLTRLEYFIDTDPGIEQGQVINLSPSASISSFPIDVNVSGLSVGQHTLYVRAKDANGNWSIVYALNFNMLGPEPSAQPTNLVFTNIQTTSMTVSWTAATGSPAGYIVLRRAGNAVEDVPKDGIVYTAGNNIGTSTVVYVGNGVTVNQTALSSGITYHYAVFAYNGSAELTNYRTSDPLRNSQATPVTPPAAQPTNINFSNVTVNSMTVGFTAASGAPAGYIGLVRAASSPTETPQNGKTYTVGETVGSSKVAFVGSGTSFPVTGLSPGTVYFYDVFSYNGAGGAESYFTTNPLEGSRTTLAAEPAAQPAGITFADITANGVRISYTAPAVPPAGYLVIRRATAAPTTDPADGTAYTVGGSLGNGTVAYVGPDVTFTETTLSANTQYFYKIYAFNGSGQSSNYRIITPLQGNFTTLDEPLRITSESLPGTYVKGNTLTVSITVNSLTKVNKVELKFRGISDAVATEKTETLNSATTTFSRTFTVNELSNEQLGMRYTFVVTATNPAESLEKTGRSYISYPATGNNAAVIPNLVFGSQQSNYQIVSVPLNLVNKAPGTVFSTIMPYNNTQARLFDFPAGGSVEREYPGFSSIDPGKGYWLIVRNNSTINPGAGTTEIRSQLDTDNPFEITLSPGWNMIGNPYNFRISWLEVLAASGNPANVDQQLKIFSSGTLSNSNTMDAWRGAFVRNNSASAVTVKVPVQRNTTLGGRLASIPMDMDQTYWEVNLSLTDGDLTNALGGIGMHPQATTRGKDAWDEESVPVVMGLPELEFQQPVMNSYLVKEVVNTQENFVWTFSVRNHPGGELKLFWPEGIEGRHELVLMDMLTNRVVDMKKEHIISLSEHSKNLKIIYGDPNFIRARLAEEIPVLGEAYPNPVSDLLNIPLYISPEMEGQVISIKVYNLLGVEVGTLAEGTFTSGYRLITWSPDVASGVYVVKFKIGVREAKSTRIVVK